jgi:transcriptional regulator with XRE-family HTH domain
LGKEKTTMEKPPHPIDRHVGGRVRLRRTLIGMSQEQLGAKLGLTFQQIQKYEKGSNRISASRLWEIASALEVPISYFYEGAGNEIRDNPQGFGESGQASIEGIAHSSESLALLRHFTQITDTGIRRAMVDMARALASSARARQQIGGGHS